MTAPHPRRWFQISLRSLFLLMLLVATWLAGYKTAMRKAEQALQAERKAAEEAAQRARLAELAAERDEQAVAAGMRWLKQAQSYERN